METATPIVLPKEPKELKPVFEWWRYVGGEVIFFRKHLKEIEAFLRAHELEELQVSAAASKTKSLVRAVDLGIRGGIRVPHLHFKDKIFLLNEQQWSEFSATVVADCQAKLANVNQISFEEGMMLESVVDALVKR